MPALLAWPIGSDRMFELQPSTGLKNIVSAATCSVPRTAWPGTVATKSYVPSTGAAVPPVVLPPLAHDRSVTRVRTAINAFMSYSPSVDRAVLLNQPKRSEEHTSELQSL